MGAVVLDALVWVPRMAFYLGPDRDGLPVELFLGAVLVRDIAVLVLCALILRDIWHPAHDVVRQTGDDDPHGGVLDAAPDSPVLLTPRRLQPAVNRHNEDWPSGTPGWRATTCSHRADRQTGG